MSLEAKDEIVYKLLNDKIYVIPFNQRKYVWNEKNWRELFDDIKLVYEGKINNHFIGSIVLKKESNTKEVKETYSIIDGQQRILTLTMFISTIAYLFLEKKELNKFLGIKKNLFITDSNNKDFPIISNDVNIHIGKLLARLYEEEIFKSKIVIKLNDFLKTLKIPDNYKKCLLFFYEQIKLLSDNDLEKIVKIKEIIEEIRYINIIAKEDEDAFTIFEILNARGQALTDFELLRNFLLKHTKREQHTLVLKKINLIEELLENDRTIDVFLKHYVIHKYDIKIIGKENRSYKIISNIEKHNDKIIFLDDLLLKAKYYNKIVYFQKCTNKEIKIFKYFKKKRQQQFRPIILGLMHKKELGELSLIDYEKYLEFLYRFFVCYHIIGEQASNKIEDIVSGYSFKIENSFNEKTLFDLKQSLLKRIPTKENFLNSIKKICYSNKWDAYSGSRKKENVHAVLEILEIINGYEGDFDDATVEHLNPDNISKDNSIIGNLILLEEQINRDLKDSLLLDKITMYEKSKYQLPKSITKYISNGRIDYEMRMEDMATQLYEFIQFIDAEEIEEKVA